MGGLSGEHWTAAPVTAIYIVYYTNSHSLLLHTGTSVLLCLVNFYLLEDMLRRVYTRVVDRI